MHLPSQILFHKNSSPRDLHTMTLGCCADEKVNKNRRVYDIKRVKIFSHFEKKVIDTRTDLSNFFIK